MLRHPCRHATNVTCDTPWVLADICSAYMLRALTCTPRTRPAQVTAMHSAYMPWAGRNPCYATRAATQPMLRATLLGKALRAPAKDDSVHSAHTPRHRFHQAVWATRASTARTSHVREHATLGSTWSRGDRTARVQDPHQPFVQAGLGRSQCPHEPLLLPTFSELLGSTAHSALAGGLRCGAAARL